MIISYGNLEGPHFTQWRINELMDLAQIINRRMGIQCFEIYYDPQGDFHHLVFEAFGVKVDVNYYKNFPIYWDGERDENWPVQGIYDVVNKVRRKLIGHPQDTPSFNQLVGP